ncbi:MAG: histidinol-phosphate transaminase [Actinomycetota bacterium]|jgi:histidinol-phosphate aminotransferase|nr:histidinol-phosphate transaminase [Actinomycetota bacterium]
MSVGRVRPAVAAMASYRPGKSAAQAENEHGITDAIKLASNENPYPPVPAVVAAIAAAAGDVNRYGDHRAADLRAAIAGWLEVDVDRVAAGCGSVGLLQQLLLAYVDPGDEVVYPWPSFEAYPIDVQLTGGVEVTVPLVDHTFDLEAVAGAVTDRTKLVLLANPNNPTGTAVHVDQLRRLVEQVPDDVLVVVDEAYREFVTADLGDPIADLQPDHPNVVVLRTFSKAFGLAALRTGYAVADPEVVVELDKVLIAFAVNHLAQVASLAAIAARDEVQTVVDRITVERDRVVAALRADGWDLPDAHANFVYLPLGSQTDVVFPEMEKRGVVVRPFPGVGMRVTIGTPAQNDRFLATLAEVAAGS